MKPTATNTRSCKRNLATETEILVALELESDLGMQVPTTFRSVVVECANMGVQENGKQQVVPEYMRARVTTGDMAPNTAA